MSKAQRNRFGRISSKKMRHRTLRAREGRLPDRTERDSEPCPHDEPFVTKAKQLRCKRCGAYLGKS